MRINTNISAIRAQGNLTRVNDEVSKSMAKLSSGFRITRAADDAARFKSVHRPLSAGHDAAAFVIGRGGEMMMRDQDFHCALRRGLKLLPGIFQLLGANASVGDGPQRRR